MLNGSNAWLARLACSIPVLAVFIAVSVALPATSAFSAECEGQIARELRRAGVPPEDVASITIKHRRGGGRAFNNYRINAWTRLHSCSGYVVVTLTPSCFVLQSSATDDCRVDGVPQF